MLVRAVAQGGLALNEPRVRVTLPEPGKLPPTGKILSPPTEGKMF